LFREIVVPEGISSLRRLLDLPVEYQAAPELLGLESVSELRPRPPAGTRTCRDSPLRLSTAAAIRLRR